MAFPKPLPTSHRVAIPNRSVRVYSSQEAEQGLG